MLCIHRESTDENPRPASRLRFRSELQALQRDRSTETRMVRAVHHREPTLGHDGFDLVRPGDHGLRDAEKVVRHDRTTYTTRLLCCASTVKVPTKTPGLRAGFASDRNFRHFSATGAPKPVWCARYTTANPPSATTASTSYVPAITDFVMPKRSFAMIEQHTRPVCYVVHPP